MRAFTLIETIFSALVISLVLLAIMNLYPSALVAVKKSESRIQATNIALSVLEEMRATPFSELTIPFVMPAAPPFEPVNLDGVTYTPTVTVYDTPAVGTPATEDDYLKGIQVTVAWESRGIQHQITEETWVHALKR